MVGHTRKNEKLLDMQQAAQTALVYLDKTAFNHHANEEEAFEDGCRMVRVEQAITAHCIRLIHIVRTVDVRCGTFSERYAARMKGKQTQIAPMAKRLFSAAQRHQSGTAMRVRRGIAASTGL